MLPICIQVSLIYSHNRFYMITKLIRLEIDIVSKRDSQYNKPNGTAEIISELQIRDHQWKTLHKMIY